MIYFEYNFAQNRFFKRCKLFLLLNSKIINISASWPWSASGVKCPLTIFLLFHEIKHFFCYALQITIEDLREEAVTKGFGLVRAKSIEFISGERKKTIRDNIPEQEMTRIWGGDRRLLLFSYSIETINMLIIPMIRTKCVKRK